MSHFVTDSKVKKMNFQSLQLHFTVITESSGEDVDDITVRSGFKLDGGADDAYAVKKE